MARYRLEGGGCLPPSVHNKLLTLCLRLARPKAPSTSSNTELLMHSEGIKHSSHRFGMKSAYLKPWTAILDYFTGQKSPNFNSKKRDFNYFKLFFRGSMLKSDLSLLVKLIQPPIEFHSNT